MSPRFNGISMQHPGAAERRNGEHSTAQLTVDRRLRSGKLDFVAMSEDDLIRVIEQAASCLRILRDQP